MKSQTVAVPPKAGKNPRDPKRRAAVNDAALAKFAVHNFVGAVLSHAFVMGASWIAIVASSRWTTPVPLWAKKTARQPSMPVNCVMDAVSDICALSTIDSEESLVDTLDSIRNQFEVADVCDKEDEAWVIESLEHVLTQVEVEGRRALNEAKAGFPVSGGSIARWVEACQSIAGRPLEVA